MTLNSLLKVNVSTKYHIVVFNKDCKNREAQADDIIAYRRFNILKEEQDDSVERIRFCEKYGKAKVEFISANQFGELDITLYV